MLHLRYSARVPVAASLALGVDLTLLLAAIAPVIGGHAIARRIIASSEVCMRVFLIIILICTVIQSLRNIIFPVRLVVNHSIIHARPSVILMPWPKVIEPVMGIDIS